MAAESEPILRFKRDSYAGGNSSGDVPRWHIAAQVYVKGELYTRYRALCGYTIDNPWLKGASLSEAQRVKGETCKRCIAAYRKAKEEEKS